MSDTVISSVFICPKCKYTNPNKSRFCMQCGTSLADTSKESQLAKLIQKEKGKVVKEFPITEKTTLGKGGDISIEGADFSKNICEFKLEKDKLILKVLADGVFLKVNPDQTLDLEKGAELKIGDKTFSVEF
jgi:RNA polymerase subunit RPABC4/transcription elongation factor Spt4